MISYEESCPTAAAHSIAGDADREVAMKDYRFCGRERDSVTGLYYFGQRYYIPWLGRWLTPDPIGPGDDHNLYRYARNNPVTLIDAERITSHDAGR